MQRLRVLLSTWQQNRINCKSGFFAEYKKPVISRAFYGLKFVRNGDLYLIRTVQPFR